MYHLEACIDVHIQLMSDEEAISILHCTYKERITNMDAEAWKLICIMDI